MIIFDPDLPLHMHQYLNEIVQDTGETVCVPLIWTPAIKVQEQQRGIWKLAIPFDQAQRWREACTQILKLPLDGPYLEVVQETMSDLEAAHHITKVPVRVV